MHDSDSFAVAAAGPTRPDGPVREAGPRTAARAVALLLALVAVPAYAADDFVQHAAHEHGKATLDLAVDGGEVTMRLSAPAVDIVGFEHAPRTDGERGAAESANVVLKQHKALFAFPVAARCAATRAAVTPPAWGSAHREHEHEHEHDHDRAQRGSRTGKSEGAHADYVAEWTFACAAPAALAFVDVKIPERFRKDLVVEANVVTETLQTRQTLRAGAVRVKLR